MKYSQELGCEIERAFDRSAHSWGLEPGELVQWVMLHWLLDVQRHVCTDLEAKRVRTAIRRLEARTMHPGARLHVQVAMPELWSEHPAER